MPALRRVLALGATDLGGALGGLHFLLVGGCLRELVTSSDRRYPRLSKISSPDLGQWLAVFSGWEKPSVLTAAPKTLEPGRDLGTFKFRS